MYGANYCSVCHENYANENREPPCFKNNICSVIGDEPFHLWPSNQFAYDTYTEITGLSSCDMNGLPTIDKIDFYFNITEMELTRKELDDLIAKLTFINSYRRYLLSKKLERKP